MGRLPGGVNTVISRTGYTGEDGFELIVGTGSAASVWEPLSNRESPTGSSRAGWRRATPCGWRPPCRFTATSYPTRSTRFRRDWGGPSSSTREISSGVTALGVSSTHPPGEVGLELEGKRIAGQGSVVFSGDTRVGEVTSGTFSPTLQVSLAMA